LQLQGFLFLQFHRAFFSQIFLIHSFDTEQ
jgi:hypothetical protein